MRPTCVFEILQLATTVLTVRICHWKDSGSKAGMSNACPLGRSLSEKATMGHLHYFNVQFSIPSSLSYQTSWYPSPQPQSFSNTVSKLHACSFTWAITLWLSCILGLISILLFAKYVNVLQWAIKQRRKKTEPRTKLTHNRYMHHSHFLDLDFSFFSLDFCFCSCSYSDFYFFYDAFGHLKETRHQTL